MSRLRPILAAGILAAALTGCAASERGNAFVPPAYAGPATLAITLPAIVPPGRAIDWVSKPNLLSSATRSVSGTFGRQTFGPIPLTAARPGCRSESAGLVCTIVVPVRAGPNQHLRLATYATKNATGPVLAIGTASLDLAARRNEVQPPVYGLAQRIAVSPATDVVHQGSWQPTQLVIYGIDAAKMPIPSVTVLNQTGASQVGDVAVTLSGFLNASVGAPDGGPLACCGIAGPIFAYDGLHTGRETFTAQASAYPRYSTRLTALPGSSAPATIVVASTYGDASTSGFIDFAEEFARDARGNAAPVRAFIPKASGKLAAEDAQGSFWVGGTHVGNAGQRLGSIEVPDHTQAVAVESGLLYAATRCSVYEYPAQRYGKPAPVRHIEFPNCNADGGLTVDRSGNVFVSFEYQSPSQPCEILEYAPGSGSGPVAPSRRIVAPVSAFSTFAGIDTDDAGNLYALNAATFDYRLMRYAPGATSGQVLLAQSMGAFAVDGAGGIYASVAATPGIGSLEYFPPGSKTPALTIAGSATRMYGVNKILIPRT